MIVMSCYDVDLIFIIILNLIASPRDDHEEGPTGITRSLPPVALRFFSISCFNILLCTFVGLEKLLQLLIDPIYMSDPLIVVVCT